MAMILMLDVISFLNFSELLVRSQIGQVITEVLSFFRDQVSGAVVHVRRCRDQNAVMSIGRIRMSVKDKAVRPIGGSGCCRCIEV